MASNSSYHVVIGRDDDHTLDLQLAEPRVDLASRRRLEREEQIDRLELEALAIWESACNAAGRESISARALVWSSNLCRGLAGRGGLPARLYLALLRDPDARAQLERDVPARKVAT